MKLSDLTADDLEAMRRAAMEYYPRTEHERAGAFVPELRRGAVMLNRDLPRVGIWRAEIHEEQLVLVRNPPLAELMVFYGLIFEKRQGEWVALGEYNWAEEVKLPDGALP